MIPAVKGKRGLGPKTAAYDTLRSVDFSIYLTTLT
jgi:hypothetical protein